MRSQPMWIKISNLPRIFRRILVRSVTAPSKRETGWRGRFSGVAAVSFALVIENSDAPIAHSFHAVHFSSAVGAFAYHGYVAVNVLDYFPAAYGSFEFL
uniref:Uncharacterized protein n=1 Tax=Romanomermis culicivorax TaxID=13658 RepID=A0A915HUR9_ROMCU